jgi:phospholipid/cholesterol/gamma-HCH transport system ATP-binding protein
VTGAIEISGVVKDYRGLRPLRIGSLTVAPGELVTILGVDQASAEVLINLITGTTLPDQGIVRVLGKATSDIQDSMEWMAVVDRFGIVSERAVLLDGLSVVQNLAIPFSLDIEPPSDDLRARAEALAQEVGLAGSSWNMRVAELNPADRTRVRFGRALALDPEVLLLEHPTAVVPREDVGAFGVQIQRIIQARGAAALTLTADRLFAESALGRVLTLDPSTGHLAEPRPGWFSRLIRRQSPI